jgi:hypothetical protein
MQEKIEILKSGKKVEEDQSSNSILFISAEKA